MSASSQVQIGMAEMPDKNSKILYSYANVNTTIDHAKKGSGQTWDYSGLTYALQLPEEYKSATSINFFFFGIQNGFGTKTADSLGVGQFMMRDIYDVFKTTSKKMTAEGRSLKYNGIPVPQFYSDADEIYQFPLKYGRKDISTFKVSFSLGNQFSMVQAGERTNEVEGEGSLITPYKTYASCIKIKSVVDEIDSIKLLSLPSIPIPRKTVEYKWFAPGVVGPVLVVSGAELLGRFTVQEIRFQDEPVSLVGFKADKYVVRLNDVVTLSDTSAITTFTRTWNITPNTFNFVNGTNAGSENPEIEFTSMGAYAVELLVRNRFGQMSEKRTNYIQVLEAVSVDQTALINNNYTLYPNPCDDVLHLGNSKPGVALEVLDLNGKIMFVDIGHDVVNVSNLKAGIYLLRIKSEEEVTFRKFQKL
tara:strand:+ start:13181 stop:14434 length:1254 start_codon:yes stop_codon:yes gene_type:complete